MQFAVCYIFFMFKLSTQTIAGAVARQVDVEVAHKGAQLIYFVDSLENAFSWEQIACALAKCDPFCEQWNQAWATLPFDFEWKPVPIHPYTAKTHPFFAVVFPAEFHKIALKIEGH